MWCHCNFLNFDFNVNPGVNPRDNSWCSKWVLISTVADYVMMRQRQAISIDDSHFVAMALANFSKDDFPWKH